MFSNLFLSGKSIVLVSLFLFSLQANAVGHVRDATISSVYCGYQDVHNMCSITFDKAIVDKDACHTINVDRMQFRGDGSMGGALLSIALAAQATQQKVHIYSTGKCTIYNGLADINFITITNK
ncbi:hypothetical protein ACVBE9_03535 [Eionea flava]